MNAVDTNVLIYAVDTDAREQGATAVALLDRLASDAIPTLLPWQVLCEFTAFIAKARHRGAAAPDAFDFVRLIRERFALITPRESVADLAIDIHLKDQVSIWDALL